MAEHSRVNNFLDNILATAVVQKVGQPNTGFKAIIRTRLSYDRRFGERESTCAPKEQITEIFEDASLKQPISEHFAKSRKA
jgi:hypothetical protein